MAEIKHVLGTIYATRMTYYSPKYRHVRVESKILYQALKYYTEKLKLSDYPTVLLKPLRCNTNKKKLYTYGFMSVTGKIIIDPRFTVQRNLLTLAHECIHVSQREKGYLSTLLDDYGTPTHIVWKGKEYPVEKITTSTFNEYQKTPWEKEAYEKEHPLYLSFWKDLAGSSDWKGLLSRQVSD